MEPATWPTWRQAWEQALYGPGGFYRCETPAAHFRTSVHTSAGFAAALLALADRSGLDSIVDIGAGGGELLAQLYAIDPGRRLAGVEVASRPPDLPAAVGWTAALPDRLDGLVVANEWLDSVPCEVVQADRDGTARVVHVEPETGRERLGRAVNPADAAWLRRWWPLRAPGRRAEVGRTRDAAWAAVVTRLSRGVAVAIDYGHRCRTRPAWGSLSSYVAGHRAAPRADGSRDLTAAVAWDSLAAAAPGGALLSQRQALGALGVAASRPALAGAAGDPGRYLDRLTEASAAAELLRPGGLGDFGWVVHARGVDPPFAG